MRPVRRLQLDLPGRASSEASVPRRCQAAVDDWLPKNASPLYLRGRLERRYGVMLALHDDEEGS
jgi:hypothetical protein